MHIAEKQTRMLIGMLAAGLATVYSVVPVQQGTEHPLDTIITDADTLKRAQEIAGKEGRPLGSMDRNHDNHLTPEEVDFYNMQFGYAIKNGSALYVIEPETITCYDVRQNKLRTIEQELDKARDVTILRTIVKKIENQGFIYKSEKR